MQSMTSAPWISDWLWGLPLIVVVAIIHVLGLGAIELGLDRWLKSIEGLRGRLSAFTVVVGATVLSATVLHAAEAAVRAGAYLWLGALPDERSAMLYSIGAMTTFGHASLHLAPEWQMLGALESLTGMLLFGLTTAFLYATIRSLGAKEARAAGTQLG